MSFTERLHARCSAPMAPDEQRLCYKFEGREYAEAHGVPVAPLLQGPCTLDELREPQRPRWVAKPNRGCTARGIVVAEPYGVGYRNVMGQNVDGWNDWRTWSEWVQWMRWCMERDGETPASAYPDEWIIEGRIGSGPGLPTEWGVYCVGGVPQFVRQVSLGGHRPGSRSRVYNWLPNGQPAGKTLQSTRKETPLKVPSHQRRVELIEYARTLAEDWPGPFVRVDFLEGENGPVFCELTPRPAGGKIKASPLWDHKMGEAWAAWESRQTVEV
jgi:hypothetical protein